MRFNKYFKSSEFDSADVIGSGVNMHFAFVSKLTSARKWAKIAFYIVSGFRTIEHNKSVGGVSDSAHLKGLAVDIAVYNSLHRFIIITALLKVGFNRIGIHKTFIHVDDDKSKPAGVIWLY